MSGSDLRIAEEIWRKLAESEARLHLMAELGELEVGFPDVEQFCLELESKYRATVTGDLRENGVKSPEWQVVKLCMKLKMIDERRVSSDLLRLKYKVRKKIKEDFGKNTRRSRNMINNLRKKAAKAKSEAMKKYEAKMKHLRKKFRSNEEDKMNKIPEALKNLNLENLSIFNKKKFEDLKTVEYEVEVKD